MATDDINEDYPAVTYELEPQDEDDHAKHQENDKRPDLGPAREVDKAEVENEEIFVSHQKICRTIALVELEERAQADSSKLRLTDNTIRLSTLESNLSDSHIPKKQRSWTEKFSTSSRPSTFMISKMTPRRTENLQPPRQNGLYLSQALSPMITKSHVSLASRITLARIL